MLIIGIGQEWRGDDAAGLLVARRLRELPGCRAPVLENSGSMIHLLDAWRETAGVILVDTIRGGGRAGDICRFPVHQEHLPAEIFSTASSHLWGVAQAVALGQTLHQLPPYLVIYGIEGQDFSLGQKPSRAVSEAICEVARLIMKEIDEFLRIDRD